MDHKILILQDTIKRLLRRKAIPNLTKIINKTHPADIAQIFGNLTEYEYKNLFNLIKSPEVAADVLSELDSSIVANIVKSLENERLSEILQAMSSDDLADLLSSLPADLSERILLAIKKEDSEDVEELLQHPADTAGRIMNPNFFALREDTTVQDAISAVRKAADAEMVFYLYVVDERNHLVGVVSLRQLIIAPPYLTLKDIMIPDVISVTTDMDQEEVARIVEKYNILAVPVVDDKNHLVGIITVDDVIDVIRSEATEDIMKMAGTVEEEYSYLDNIFKASRFRLPWLITNLLGGLLTGYLMWLFKITLKEVLALVTFVPVITGMGGNVGTQSSSIVVRGIAIGRIDYSKIYRVLFREVRVGFLMGLTCGLVVGFIGYIWHHNFILGIVVGISMTVAMTVAATMGAMVPAFFHKIKIDPAIASGPFVTTANDITGILIYFGCATFFLKYLLAG